MELKEQLWTYTSHGVKQEVYCNRFSYLFIKLYYDDNGLTDEEYEEYKKYCSYIKVIPKAKHDENSSS